MNALQIMSQQTRKPNWKEIESNWLSLPILFKTFHENFNLSTVGNYFSYAYLKDNNIETFGFYTHPIIKNITIDTFFELDSLKWQLAESLNLEYEEDFDTFNKNLIPIAHDSNGALLMLGVGEENADKIYYYVRHWDERLKLLSENIFEFFKDYHIEIDESYLCGVPLEKLYRNWNDTFWSVREDGDPTSIIEEIKKNKDKEISDLKIEKDKYYYKLKALARDEKKGGMSLDVISEKYGFSVEELEKSFF